jgi:hypothetical protein
MLCSYAANTLTISSASGHPGDELTVSMSLTNSDAVTALQANIRLSESLSLVAGSAALNSARSNGHSLMANVANGVLRIAVFSVSNATLKGSEGELLTFRLKLGNEPATYPLIADLTLAGANGEQLTADATEGSVTLLSPKIEVVNTSIDYGHVPIRSTYTRTLQVCNTGNEPLELTAFEFSAQEFSVENEALSIAAGQTENIVITFAPTVQGAISEQLRIRSNAVNAHDVYGANRCALIADPYSVNELRMQAASGISDETVTVSVRMNNMEDIVGVQFSLKLPEQLEFVPGSATPLERAASHFALTKQSHDTLTVILYNMSNTPVSGDDGDLLTLQFRLNGRSGSYALRPINTLLVNTAQQNMVSAVYQAYVTIQSPTINVPTSADFGSIPVTQPDTLNIAVRNTGNAALTLQRATFLMEGFRVLNELPVTIARNQTETLRVQFTPTKEGSFTTTMQLYSNDPASRMKSIRLTVNVYEPNELSLVAEPIEEESLLRLSINLDNVSQVSGLQFDLHGVAPWTTARLTERAEGLQLVSQPTNENTYRFILFSLSNTCLSGNSGTILEIEWNASAATKLNGATVLLDNPILGGPSHDNPANTRTLSVNDKAFVTIINGNNDLAELYLDDDAELTVTPEGNLAVSSPVTVHSLLLHYSEDSHAQISGIENLSVDVLELVMRLPATEGILADQWFAFAVPFEVNLATGIRCDGSDEPARSERDFVIYEFDGYRRATQQRGWHLLAGDATLLPGHMYMLGTQECTAWRFTAAAPSAISEASSATINENHSTFGAHHSGWNGIANPKFCNASAGASEAPLTTTYNNRLGVYEVQPTEGLVFNAAAPFFVQVEEGGSLLFNTAAASSVVSRQNDLSQASGYSILSLADERYTDRAYLSFSADKQDAYTIGHDLQKNQMSTTPSVPQLWVDAYNMRLSAYEALLSAEDVTVPLGMYAPEDGVYTLAASGLPATVSATLMHNGLPVQYLTEDACRLTLSAGNNSGYALRIQSKSDITTGISTVSNSANQKVLIDNCLFILRDGQTYTATGVRVR